MNILNRCKSILGEDNKPKDLGEDEKKKIMHDIIEKMANDGLRTICIAYKDLGKESQNWDDEDKIIKDLICIGIVGIEDPVREEVRELLNRTRKKHSIRTFRYRKQFKNVKKQVWLFVWSLVIIS
jgi:Ca2+ transporting ATPase